MRVQFLKCLTDYDRSDELQTTRRHALAGSVLHLKSLIPILARNDALLPEVLPVVYRYLPTNIPSSVSSPIDRSAADPPHVIALGLLLSGLSSTQIGRPRIVADLKRHWGVIWKWCRIVILGYLDEPGTSHDVRAKHHTIVFGLLTVLSSNHDLLSMLGLTDGFISLLTRVWRYEISWYILQSHRSATIVLRHLVRAFSSLHEPFLSGLGSSPEAVARCIVDRIAATSTRLQIPSSILEADLMIMHYTQEDPIRWRWMIAANAIGVLAYTMRRLTSHTLPCDDAVTARSCLRLSITLILLAIKEDGVHQVACALEGRMLVSMFKTMPATPPTTAGSNGTTAIVVQVAESEDLRDLNRVYASVLQVITPYLVYRSVFRGAVKSLKTIRTLNLERKCESVVPKKARFWKCWALFKDYTADRAVCNAAMSGDFHEMSELNVSCQNVMVWLNFAA